jgi:uncharacterized repeat protein (TIGR03847 family)
MPRQVFFFDPPDRFVAGTVGQPGERTFFLQASSGGRVTSVALEKIQVSALAERLTELLDEVRRRLGDDVEIPAAAPSAVDDVAPLDTPLMEEFRVGTLALAWDGDTGRVVIEAHAATESEEEVPEPEPMSESEEGPDVLRVRITAEQARAFVKRAETVVAAGRPPCPFCGLPLDPAGHVCPRQNGRRG